MTAAEVEGELRSIDDPAVAGPVTGAVPLPQEDALAFKRAGNLPDDQGRTLRLVIRAEGTDPESIARRRVLFEPDYHDAPAWRRPGSKPVNVIPRPAGRSGGDGPQAWWEDPAMEALETEWRERGTAGGVKVPGEYRSFVFKTVAALRAADREVTAATIADSIARWVPEPDAAEIRTALLEANRT